VTSYAELLSSAGLEAQARGIWSLVGQPEGDFGWKLHLSSTQVEAVALLCRVSPLLEERGVAFKVARDSTILAILNEGGFGATQVGKLVTIYPSSPDACRRLALELVELTAGLTGPKIISDLHLGGIVYARYGSINPPISRDRLGNVSPHLPEGRSEYTVPFATPDGVENPFAGISRPSLSIEKQSGPIGPGYLVLEPIQVHAKGSVLLAMDVRSQDSLALVVLKEGRRHCVSDDLGRDMFDRLRHQASMHRRLRGKASMPRADAPFEWADNMYLPLEHVSGEELSRRPATPFASLGSAARRRLMGDLRDVAAALSRVHAQGAVHRDLTPRNVIVGDSGPVLLDFELGQFVSDPSPPFGHGTPGYMSPRQERGESPTFADDLFSLGALIASLITGLDAQRLLYGTDDDRRADRLRALSGAPQPICAIAGRCLDPDESRRPAISEVLSSLDAGLGAPARATPAPPPPDRAELVRRCLHWVGVDAPRDRESEMWLSPEIEASNHETTPRHPRAFRVYRSASRGVSGILYAIARLKRFGYSAPAAERHVDAGVDWLLRHEPTADDQMPGLHFGEAGVAVAIAEAARSGLIERDPWFEPYLDEALAGPVDWPDLTHGAAGQCLAAIACAQATGLDRLAAHAQPSVDFLLASQRRDGSWDLPSGVRGMTGSTYSGLAHGVAGIVYALATYARWSGLDEVGDAALRGRRWLRRQARIGEEPSCLWWSLRTDTEERWHWWCHGAPGIALALLAVHEMSGDADDATQASLALAAHPVEVRYSNLSQCHGLSGLGEIYLEAHRVLGGEEWLQRAEKVGDTLARLARVDSFGARWLVENPFEPTPDLMIGCTGVAHFLGRLGDRKRDWGMPLVPDPLTSVAALKREVMAMGERG
jgi:serine/threonine protein kinase